MTCGQISRLLPGYLDGALPESLGPQAHAAIASHLQTCFFCRTELESYRRIQRMMSLAARPEPPRDLGTSIRLAVSNARAVGGVRGRLGRAKDRLELVLKNIFEPLALPATGGIAVALLVFAIVYQVLGPGMPVSAATPDLPTNLLQPARLEVLAGFQMSELEETTRTGGDHPLLVEAMVNADGGRRLSRYFRTGRSQCGARTGSSRALLSIPSGDEFWPSHFGGPCGPQFQPDPRSRLNFRPSIPSASTPGSTALILDLAGVA